MKDEARKIDQKFMWLMLGRRNHWIGRANDPPFTLESFCECSTREELKDCLGQDNWCLGQAFYLENLCFINQINGGDEWLVIRDNLPFKSITFSAYHPGDFDKWLDRVAQATDQQLKNLEY